MQHYDKLFKNEISIGKMATVIEEGIYKDQDKSQYLDYCNFNADNNIINSHENNFDYECQLYGSNNMMLECY